MSSPMDGEYVIQRLSTSLGLYGGNYARIKYVNLDFNGRVRFMLTPTHHIIAKTLLSLTHSLTHNSTVAFAANSG